LVAEHESCNASGTDGIIGTSITGYWAEHAEPGCGVEEHCGGALCAC
jgi:hypothetical protein